MKGDRLLSEFDVDWPAGDYCLLKYGSCPTGRGSIPEQSESLIVSRVEVMSGSVCSGLDCGMFRDGR